MHTGAASNTVHSWKFNRVGGLDQVALETSADLLNLEHLDQKLWVALSCPAIGLEIDDQTLALIDSNGDGRIRPPELLQAVQWAVARLKNPQDLLQGHQALPLHAISDQIPEGELLLASARRIMHLLSKPQELSISVADIVSARRILAAQPIKGDGVIGIEAAVDEKTRSLISHIIACSDTAISGITEDNYASFFKEVDAYLQWADKACSPEIEVLGSKTAKAVETIEAVRVKVDDYFARCRLAAFDSRAIGVLNRSETEYLNIAAKDLKLSAEEVSEFPLATIAPGKPLPIVSGVNPAWASSLAELQKHAISPVFEKTKVSLSESEWLQLCAHFAPYKKYMALKPNTACEKLGYELLKTISHGAGKAELEALFVKDKEIAPEIKAMGDINRLVRYYSDLRALLHNFINFADFYSCSRGALFQAGTLFLDARSTDLCIRMTGPNPLAAMSQIYIAYCSCTRSDSAPFCIAACFTQGDSDYLFVGRHGIFYDRQGRDWDAVITSIIDNPISIGQAFWSPYKKLVRFVEQLIAKRAAAADEQSTSQLSTTAESAIHTDKTKPSEPPKKFDLALITGIGVALGSIGGFLAAILFNFVSLGIWMPLGVVGLIMAISTPSIIIAWLKLRQRTLGPILDASGWAVNGRVKISFPLGSLLTRVAQLPTGTERSFEDPFDVNRTTKSWRRTLLLLFFLILVGVAATVYWDLLKGYFGKLVMLFS